MAPRAAGRCRGDAGAYVVIYALLAVAMATMTAIVLDLAALRQGRRADRAAADLAATAGAGVLDALDPSTFAPACQAAWDYVVINRDDADGPVSAPDCTTTFPESAACDPAAPATVNGTYGPLQVSITYPIPNGHALMASEVAGGDQAQPVSGTHDGTPCQRVGVRIVRDRTFLFGAVAGTNSGRTDVHAVARSGFSAPSAVVPAVVSLERFGCDGVSTTADGGTLAVAGGGQPGRIAVDSDASACAGFAIRAPAPSSLNAGVSGVIESYALSGSNFARAWTGSVVPAPSAVVRRLTQGFLDVRYNCGPPCGEAQGKLDALRAALGTGPAAPAGMPTYAGACIVAPGETIVVPGDVFVDCPVLLVEGKITFLGARTVVAGGIDVAASGCLAINDGSCGAAGIPPQDSVLFLRAGGITKADKGDVVLDRVFVHSGAPFTIPRADPFGASRLHWRAPIGGDFEDLLAWTDAAGTYAVGEQQTTLIEGTIAAPNATVLLEAKSGSGTTQPVQLVANRVRLQGTGTFTLNPTAGRATGKVARPVKLIR
ncbi:MAG TPA: hypothetical protein VF230_11230 [Acidimicrobiales bacterium]